MSGWPRGGGIFTPPSPPRRYVHANVWERPGLGATDPTGILIFDDPNWEPVTASYDGTHLSFLLPPLAQYGWHATLNITHRNLIIRLDITVAANLDIDLSTGTIIGRVPHGGPIPRPRQGLVRVEGRNWIDDDGFFYPLGATCFVALHLYKFDRARLNRNLQWLSDHGVDYVRIFSVVGFAGAEIDPKWDDYDATFTGYIDHAYNTYGLRTELCIFAGMDEALLGSNQVGHARRVCQLLEGREHMILNIEACNEAFQNMPDMALLERITREIQAHTTVPLVAASNDLPLGASADRSEQSRAQSSIAWGATLATVHMSRYGGEHGWFEATVPPWEWRHAQIPCTHNESVGPTSSVWWETDPVRLATLRAVGILSGVGAMVGYHTGAGVDMIAHTPREGDPFHVPNAANLFEEPNADAILSALRGVDAWIPPGSSDGVYFDMLGFSPITCDASWAHPYNHDHGVHRGYLSTQGQFFWAILAGIQHFVDITTTRPCTIDVQDILNGPTRTLTLQPSQPTRIYSLSEADGGRGTTILTGTFTDIPPLQPEMPKTGDGRNDWKTYFFNIIGRHEGDLANDWEAVLAASGIPQGPPPGMKSNPGLLFGLSQQIGSDGPRARLFLPTNNPDSNNFYTHPIDLLNSSADHWAWVDRGGPEPL